MHHLFSIFFGVVASSVFLCDRAFSIGTTDPRFEPVRAIIADVMAEQNAPSIAVAVAHRGNIIWQEGFGWADIEQQIPATAHTAYSLASISKPITATALMILVERGTVNLDQPINNYLGTQKVLARVGDVREATVRRVLNHTAGLPTHYNFYYEDEILPRPSMTESIRRYGVLTRPPGEMYVYSNFGFGLLEEVIQQVSGQSYSDFLRTELFAPLSLKESAVNRTPDLKTTVAVRYSSARTPVPFYDFDHRGASALYMSANDLVRFGLFHLGHEPPGIKPPLSLMTRRLMREQLVDGDAGEQVGLGWFIADPHHESNASELLPKFRHDGGMAGVATELAIYPEEDLVVVVLANARIEHQGVARAIVHAVVPHTIRREHGFQPAANMVGIWKGLAHVTEQPVDVTIEIRTTGEVFAKVGEASNREVTDVSLQQNGELNLSGILADIRAADIARFPHRVNFELRLRNHDKDAMIGTMFVEARPMPSREGSGISFWTDLRRTPAKP
jgi:CubicO group peptidase (beta-lactamase class C family)